MLGSRRFIADCLLVRKAARPSRERERTPMCGPMGVIFHHAVDRRRKPALAAGSRQCSAIGRDSGVLLQPVPLLPTLLARCGLRSRPPHCGRPAEASSTP